MNAKGRYSVYGLFSGVLLSMMMLACSDNDTGSTRVEVRLTDGPGDYEEVNIDIQDVQLNAQDGNPISGWHSLSINKGIYDLLTLTNGLDTLLGGMDLPAGKISQIRLVLGENNSVKVKDQVRQLETPSAQQSGLKVQVHTELKEGITYSILLDFDAARSIVATGIGKYNLKPVIRAVAEAEDGAIKGLVDPVASSPVVYAIIGSDAVSTSANATGNFLVRGLAAGTYKVVFVPLPGFQTKEVPDVAVSVDHVTDLGTVELN